MKKLLIAASFFLLFTGVFAVRAYAADVTLTGAAWSDQYGWINFKGPSGQTYGVKLDTATDLLKGQAWSDKLGWITFDAAGTNSQGDLTGCPSGTCNASINLNNGKVTGWAKIKSLNQWIHLSPTSGNSYGVTYDQASQEFSGEGWSDYAGWIKFKGTIYVVKTEAAIVDTKLLAPTLNSVMGASQTSMNLVWTNNDTKQNGNAIERAPSATGPWATTTTGLAPQGTTYTDNGLTKGTTYYYRMVATSPSGNSDYSNIVPGTTLTTTNISVTVSPSTAGWTIKNDHDTTQIHMTGNHTVTVTPDVAGTIYTITGDIISNYDWPPDASCDYGDNNGENSPCTKLVLIGGENASFALNYSLTGCTDFCAPVDLNYSLSPASQSLTVQKATEDTQSGHVTITKTYLSGQTGSVNLDVVGSLPTGVSIEYVPISARDCSPDCAVIVQFDVAPTSIPGGPYAIKFAGSPAPFGNGNNSAIVNLTITPSAGILVSCAVNPNHVEVNESATWSVTHKEGGNGNYISTQWYAGTNTVAIASGDSFTTSYPTSGHVTLRAKVTDSVGNSGYCTSVTLGVGTSPGFEEF